MNRSRRSLLSISAFSAVAAAGSAYAQFGGRPRDRGDTGSPRSMPRNDANPRGANPPLFDPVVAIERELPSLRIDLKLTADQALLFDGFERQVRNVAEAGRLRARHLSKFRGEEGSAATADALFGTLAADDIQRAEGARLALEQMRALQEALTADQRKQFDRRILQSLREPLGSS